MKGDVALAGFVMTAEEWAQLDSESRSQLLTVALRRDEPPTPAPQRPAPALGSGPIGPIRESE